MSEDLRKKSATNSVKEHFFQMHAQNTTQCYEPKEICASTAINAHSIQKKSVLDRLSENGHVIMPKMLLQGSKPSSIRFDLVGCNKATTFTGLCDKHDNEIFKSIDDFEFDLNNSEQLFLLAYRSVLREYHVVRQNAVRFQSVYQKRVDEGLSPGNEPCDAGIFALEHCMNAFDSYEYKRKFDSILLQNEKDKIKHEVILVSGQNPTIAVSSMYSLDEFPGPNDVPRVCLNIFPVQNDVVIVFSWLAEDDSPVKSYLQSISSSMGKYQLYLVSKAVIQSCDNFVISPAYFNFLSESQRNTITDFYAHTAFYDDNSFENPDLFLF